MMTLISLFWKFDFSSLWNCKIPKESAPKRPQIKKFVYNQLLIYFFKGFFWQNAHFKMRVFFVQDFHFLNFFAEAFEEKLLQYGETNTFWSQTGAPDWTKIRRQIWRYVKMTSLIVLSSVIRSIITCEEIETHVPSVLRALRVHSSLVLRLVSEL